MQTFKFNRAETNLFDGQHINLVYNQEMLLPFIQRTFSKENIEKQVDLKSDFSQDQRLLLVDALDDQYQGVEVSEATRRNIDSLKDQNTFTITTGHQMSLFTGPLYFVVKILHVIKQCELLNNENGENHFVPVYWMASEDHDFEEIQSLNLFNKKITWESDEQGPVGRYSLQGLEEVKSELSELFKDSEEMKTLINSLQGDNYAEAFRRFVNELFGKYGLIIIDGDDKSLKKAFAPIVEKELREQFSFEAVSITNAELKREGVKQQVHARELNLFYIEKGIRRRIVQDGHEYVINDIATYTIDEVMEVLKDSPEKFSPNVVLRPVYQESILPNVLYVGGGGEMSYWLQLKRVFESAGVIYPLIQVRNSVVWIDKNLSKKLAKFDLQLEDIFKSTDLLKKEYIESNESDVLDFNEIVSKKELLQKDIEEMVISIDSGLDKYLRGELTRMDKQIDGIKSKLIKVSKTKHEEAMNAIDLIGNRLFPQNGLQERKSNFFHFCVRGDVSDRMDMLYSALEPFEKDLIVIRDV